MSFIYRNISVNERIGKSRGCEVGEVVSPEDAEWMGGWE
jgi:hypothetical protein